MSYFLVSFSKIAHSCLQANSTAVVDTLDPDQPGLKPQDGEDGEGGQESLDKLEPIVEVLGNERIRRSAAAPDILGALGAGKNGRKDLTKYVYIFLLVFGC